MRNLCLLIALVVFVFVGRTSEASERSPGTCRTAIAVGSPDPILRDLHLTLTSDKGSVTLDLYACLASNMKQTPYFVIPTVDLFRTDGSLVPIQLRTRLDNIPLITPPLPDGGPAMIAQVVIEVQGRDRVLLSSLAKMALVELRVCNQGTGIDGNCSVSEERFSYLLPISIGPIIPALLGKHRRDH